MPLSPRIQRLRAAALAGVLSVAALAAAAPAAAMAVGGEYRYAGIVGSDVTTGVRARIVPLSPPAVEEGHVAAWIGVGGLDVGPNGEDEWIQVGLASFEGSTTRLYYEVMRGVGWPEYVEVDPEVARGESHRVAVVEMAGRPAHWRVWVDGRPVSEPVFLRFSHRAWEPVATAESWSSTESRSRANGFHYRFRELSSRGARPGWRAFSDPYVIEDSGLDLVRTSSRSFRAFARRAGRPLGRMGRRI